MDYLEIVNSTASQLAGVLFIGMLVLQLPYLVLNLGFIKMFWRKITRKRSVLDIEIPKEVVNTINKYGEFEIRPYDTDKYVAFAYQAKSKSYIFLSKQLIKDFEPNDYEYFIIHEIGHIKTEYREYIRKNIRIDITIIIASLLIINLLSFHINIILIFIAGLVFGLRLKRVFRNNEDRADLFAAREIGIEKIRYCTEKLTSKGNNLPKWLIPFMYHRRLDDKIRFLDASLNN